MQRPSPAPHLLLHVAAGLEGGADQLQVLLVAQRRQQEELWTRRGQVVLTGQIPDQLVHHQTKALCRGRRHGLWFGGGGGDKNKNKKNNKNKENKNKKKRRVGTLVGVRRQQSEQLVDPQSVDQRPPED